MRPPRSFAERIYNIRRWIGAVDQMVDDLRARRQRWGISYYMTHEPYLDALASVVAHLAGT